MHSLVHRVDHQRQPTQSKDPAGDAEAVGRPNNSTIDEKRGGKMKGLND